MEILTWTCFTSEVEKYENIADIAGDANQDGVFNSADLVAIFQAGEYEDGIPGNSVESKVDFYGDGDFDSSALKEGIFQSAVMPWMRPLALELQGPARLLFDKTSCPETIRAA